ncbi:peptidoglycan editing factor PgeF [Agrilutibacter solisilvae]|uniref:Purine nucleoside phosphorylase n=1 Tax=Agrilutibacter solisilvae TaxID=2763317 RepID=A0A975AS98_9GAMM|nr:peptidoglycan editing factor PgeF [Lysobacter solisilvae]QSX78532.1 peptidoglycan editing factor PgeF [Lysobacter solisilvae]
MDAAFLHADWPAPPGVRGFTTLRSGPGGSGPGTSAPPFDRFNLGLRSGDDAVTVHRNRDALREAAGLPAAPHWLAQVHGTQVVRFDAPASPTADGDCRSMEPEADAAVTSVPACVLAILTADCLPVLFAAKDGREVAAAHAGWRGLCGGVLEATLAAMRTPPDQVIAWLGPAAGPGDYEIGVEVYDAFVSRDWSAGEAFTVTRPDHWRVDLYALARRRLTQAGMAAADIHGGGLSTIAEPARFYSHRRDQRTGRMASLVWIAPAR